MQVTVVVVGVALGRPAARLRGGVHVAGVGDAADLERVAAGLQAAHGARRGARLEGAAVGVTVIAGPPVSSKIAFGAAVTVRSSPTTRC
jgi:hypothetical protein